MNVIDLCERGYVPDPLARFGMRRLIARRLEEESRGDAVARHAQFVRELRQSPIAVHTGDANAQHYEVPAEFFRLHLGPRLKYSCCLYENGARPPARTLAQAEDAMLELCAQRAGVADGQRILDLGCGWGSLSLWLAERYPRAQVVGLSNSSGQREFITARARERGLANVTIVTGNVVEFDPSMRAADAALLGSDAWHFDRILSIEMFEHMRNYEALLAKVARWLAPGGELFVHVFAHHTLAYPFEARDGSDWMSRHFFTGGLMPSARLLGEFQQSLRLAQQWWVDGTQYERTANDWLAGMDAKRDEILAVFRAGYGGAQAALQFQRWRMFYMAVAELFGYEGGSEWGVAHYRFARP
jgi:cyclopropane-fatty-acyl-phospholipid synthase